MKVAIILPVYNEEARLELGVTRTLEFIRANISLPCKIYIVDNASNDSTGEKGRMLEQKYNTVSYLRIESKGVGAAFRAGVMAAYDCDVVGYMDIDLSADIMHLKEIEELFASGSIDIVNGSRLNRKSLMTGRRWYRNITSYSLVFMLKVFLGMRASDAVCGFKFFRRDIALRLMEESSPENGWFYIIELLLRAEREGLRIYELPVRWTDDADHSTVDMPAVIMSYLKGIMTLRKTFRNEERQL